jgi:hypothetical protein
MECILLVLLCGPVTMMPRYKDQEPAPAVSGTRHELKAEDG